MLDALKRDRRLVAAAVVVALLALVVVGRLQGQNLGAGDAGPSRAIGGTAGTDDTLVASGLAVAGRVALPGQAVGSKVCRHADSGHSSSFPHTLQPPAHQYASTS
jgi:hypothetical protein